MSVAHSMRKVVRPILPPTILCRTSLMLRLKEAIAGPMEGFPHHRLVLLNAPAGYGKTTLLADFARNTSIPCCWYFLDNTDTDKYSFLGTLLASIRLQFPTFGTNLDSFLTITTNAQHTDHHVETFIDMFVASIATEISERFAIFLCNYQETNNSPVINSLVNAILHKLPENCVFVIESRVLPNLAFASLLAQRTMTSIGNKLLRFTAQEIRDLARLQEMETLSEEQAEQIFRSFDGWITGILLGTSLGNVEILQKGEAQLHINGSLQRQILKTDRQHLLSYVVNEVFKHDPEMLTFLKEASILHEMTPDLCTELLAIPDASKHLRALEQRGLFVTHHDEDTQIVYTCHPVLRELLYEELRHQSRERFLHLHRHATQLLQARNDHAKAIHHAFEAGMEDTVAHLILASCDDKLAQGRVELLRHWIDMLSYTTKVHYPKLLLIQASISLMSGDHASALSLLDQTDHVLTEGLAKVDPDTIPLLEAESTVIRSKALFQRGEYTQVQALCQQVIERLPVDETKLRAEARMRLGVCANLLGDLNNGISQLQQALQLWGRHTIGRQTAEVHSALASAYSLLGNFALAEHHITRAILCWKQLHDEWGKINNMIRLGLIKQRQGLFIEAEETFTQALHLSRGTVPFLPGQAYALVNLGELYQDQGLYERSLAVTEDGLALARQMKDKYLINCALCILAMSYLYMGDANTALVLISETDIQNDASAVPSYEQVIHELAYNTVLLYQRRYDDVYTRLSRMEQTFQKIGLKREQIYVILRMSACQFAQGRTNEWMQHMKELTRLLDTQNGYEHIVLTELRRLPKLYHAVETLPTMGQLRKLLRLESEVPETVMPLNEGESDPPLPPHETAIASLQTHPEQPLVEIRALGEPAVCFQGEPITRWRMARSMELFFFLLDSNHPMRKEQIITALWPEVDEQINQTFHSTVYYLRKALGGFRLISQGGAYSLDLASYGGNVLYDVEAFQRYQDQAKQALSQENDRAAREALHAMIDLYRGDYVQSFYSDWCIFRRDKLRRAYLDARSQLAQIAWRHEQFDESAIHWQHALVIDNCLEQAHYGLMRCYLRQGKRGLALRQYQRCRDILQSELGVEPGNALRQLYQRLTHSSS